MTAAEQVRAVVEAQGTARVSETEWAALRTALPRVSPATLRKHLSNLGVDVEQPWRGVDISSLETLMDTLLGLAKAYPKHGGAAREEVIQAKDKSRFAAENVKVATEKRDLKREMIEWMLVWLDDPCMFADWVGLRREVLTQRPQELGKTSRAKRIPL